MGTAGWVPKKTPNKSCRAIPWMPFAPARAVSGQEILGRFPKVGPNSALWDVDTHKARSFALPWQKCQQKDYNNLIKIAVLRMDFVALLDVLYI